MTAEQLFTLCTYTVLPGWALLILLPRWRWSARLICPVIVPSLLAGLYVWLLIWQAPQIEGGFDSLPGVARLFKNPYALLAGWIHYLAFDLFIGSWEVRNAQRLRVSHWLVAPCLLLTLLFGPAGLLLYLGLRGLAKRRFALDAASFDAASFDAAGPDG